MSIAGIYLTHLVSLQLSLRSTSSKPTMTWEQRQWLTSSSSHPEKKQISNAKLGIEAALMAIERSTRTLKKESYCCPDASCLIGHVIKSYKFESIGRSHPVAIPRLIGSLEFEMPCGRLSESINVLPLTKVASKTNTLQIIPNHQAINDGGASCS